MHYRSQIKAKLVELLTRKANDAYPTIAGGRVYKNRYQPLSGEIDEQAHIPAVFIFALTEDVTKPGEVDYTQNRRTLPVIIECYTDGQTADDDLDLLTNQVEVQIQQAGDTLEGLLEWFYLVKTELAYDPESESTIQVAKMTFEAKYLTPSTVQAIDGLARVELAYVDAAGSTVATDDVEMPQ